MLNIFCLTAYLTTRLAVIQLMFRTFVIRVVTADISARGREIGGNLARIWLIIYSVVGQLQSFDNEYTPVMYYRGIRMKPVECVHEVQGFPCDLQVSKIRTFPPSRFAYCG